MKVNYKRDLRHNYMVITKEDGMEPEFYCIKMLEQQKIEGLLPFEQHDLDNQTLYYYDITGKQSMVNLMDKAALSYDKVKNILSGILNVLDTTYEYLLPEDDMIISPEYIYLDVVTYQPSLCFLSGLHQNCKEQISTLLEYLMNKVDYNDKAAVLLVYQLYAASREEGFSQEHLYEVIRRPFQEETADKAVQHSGGDTFPDMDQKQEERRREVGYKDTSKKGADHKDIDNKSVDNREVNTRSPARITRREEKILTGYQSNSKKHITHEKTEASSTQKRKKITAEAIEQYGGEEEIRVYPVITYLLTAMGIAGGLLLLYLGFQTGILYNSFGERLEYDKLIALILIILCGEGFLMSKLWDKKNRLVKIVPKKEGIVLGEGNTNPDKELYHRNKVLDKKELLYEAKVSEEKNESRRIRFEENQDENTIEEDSLEEDDNPTCLLNETSQPSPGKTVILLQSLDETAYPSIEIKDIPFFIGKLKKNVDYCLEKDVVSRYHAKITKEEETYYLTDLNSRNGTFINQEPLTTYEPREITFGDEIAFANITYQLIKK